MTIHAPDLGPRDRNLPHAPIIRAPFPLPRSRVQLLQLLELVLAIPQPGRAHGVHARVDTGVDGAAHARVPHHPPAAPGFFQAPSGALQDRLALLELFADVAGHFDYFEGRAGGAEKGAGGAEEGAEVELGEGEVGDVEVAELGVCPGSMVVVIG